MTTRSGSDRIATRREPCYLKNTRSSSFHDNSAKDLDEVAVHYSKFFAFLGLTLTEQDQKDMVAYMKLLQ